MKEDSKTNQLFKSALGVMSFVDGMKIMNDYELLEELDKKEFIAHLIGYLITSNNVN